MVIELVTCWVVTHTRADKLDYRDVKQFHGYVLHETSDTLTVNFYDAFKKAKIDPDFNPPVQTLGDSECSYER